MKVIGICIGSYPYGGATTVRHMAMMKGLKELHYDVSLYSIYPDKNQDLNSQALSGFYNGIPFTYTVKNLFFTSKKIKKYFELLVSTIVCISQVKKLSKEKKIVIINFITNPFIAFLITFFLRKNNIILHEITEYPFIRKYHGMISRFIYYKLTLPLFDKIFIISTGLKEYLKRFVRNEKLQIINMFVDLERFEYPNKSPFGFEYIAYCGSMNTDKDGVPILIDAFSIVNNKYPNLKLVLIGDITNRPISNEILQAVNRSGCKKYIIFTGHINNCNIPQYLQNAKILTLARPDNIQARGGFPTKLGEYLATGNPVVLTNVGDIPKFLKNEEHAFLSEPDFLNFADTILTVLDNYSKAKLVGNKGKSFAKEFFNYKTQCLKIANTIKFKE